MTSGRVPTRGLSLEVCVRRFSTLCVLVGLSIPTLAAAVPVIDAPASLNFGGVLLGSSTNLTLAVGNTGNLNLSVTAISISGAEFSFATTPPVPVTIPPGGIINYTVRFAPTSIGSKSGTVSIASTDPMTPTKVVSLSGTGLGAVISVSVPALDYGNVNVLASADRSLSIGNDGNQILTVSSVGFSGTDASLFSIPATPPFPAAPAPGAFVTFTVRFSPTSAGSKTASLTLNSSDPVTPAKVVSMQGTGVGATISTTPPSILAFGDVHVATTADQNVIITNAGGGTLSLASFSFSGASAGSFSLVSPPTLPLDLGPSATLILTVRCAPATIGAKVATLSIASNDASTPAKQIVLTANSIRPEPVIAGARDVPNDQGGRVKLSWDASTYDTQPTPIVDHYWIFRSVPPQAAMASGEPLHAIDGRRLEKARFYTSRFGTSTYYWELLDVVPALHFIQGYSHITATLSDSTGTYNPYTLFMVMALDAGNTIHWDSAPDSGYSVDNLPPGAPASLTGSYSNSATHLHWTPNGEADLAGYRIYRGASAGFVPDPANLVGAPPDTG